MATRAKLDHESLAAKLTAIGQGHVYTFYAELTGAEALGSRRPGGGVGLGAD